MAQDRQSRVVGRQFGRALGPDGLLDLLGQQAMESSSTARPWRVLRTPLMILIRNGSVTPLRLTTASTASSTVVNRLPHSGKEPSRRMGSPASASRESTTRESACRQYGRLWSASTCREGLDGDVIGLLSGAAGCRGRWARGGNLFGGQHLS